MALKQFAHCSYLLLDALVNIADDAGMGQATYKDEIAKVFILSYKHLCLLHRQGKQCFVRRTRVAIKS